MRSEADIRAKIDNSFEALQDFAKRTDATPEDFFIVARQATYMTALYWVLGEEVPEAVTKLAVPIIKKMAEVQGKAQGGEPKGGTA